MLPKSADHASTLHDSYVCFCWAWVSLVVHCRSCYAQYGRSVGLEDAVRSSVGLAIPLFLIAYFAPGVALALRSQRPRLRDAARALRRMQTKQNGEGENPHSQPDRLYEAQPTPSKRLSSWCLLPRMLPRQFHHDEPCSFASSIRFNGGAVPLDVVRAVTFFRRAGLSQEQCLQPQHHHEHNVHDRYCHLVVPASRNGTPNTLLARCRALLRPPDYHRELGLLRLDLPSPGPPCHPHLLCVFYNCTIGPVAYTIIAELPSSRLLAKSIVLARLTYVLTGLITNTLTPRMLSPDAWNWGAKGAFLYLGTCGLILVILLLRPT